MIDRENVDAMTRVMAALRGEAPAPVLGANGLPAPVEVSETDAMASILTRFYAASDTALMNGITDPVGDKTLRTALVTEATEAGVAIGNYEIRVKQTGIRKLYDVSRLGGFDMIATDLTLYEAAFGIARALNDNEPITCPLIRNILVQEANYAKALGDAIHHKHSLRKITESSRRDIVEARYDAAQQKAAYARLQVETLVGDL